MYSSSSSATWEGFTSTDIENIQEKTTESKHTKQINNDANKNPTNTFQRSNHKPSRTKPLMRRSTNDREVPINAVAPEAFLSSQNVKKEQEVPTLVMKESLNSSSNMSSSCSSLNTSSTSQSSPAKSTTGLIAKNVQLRLMDNNAYELIDSTENGLDDRERSPRDDVDNGYNLERFQLRQKEMEEQNRRRRDAITKAILDRQKRTVTEAHKLHQIQDELGKLDARLSNDVSILRNQIEIASLDFNEAQKRYDRAENEYIESKLMLFNKMEKKELLTEHLCRIIEANEQRKANKLSELMTKLEMVDLEMDNEPIIQVFPHSVGLNEVTYTACTTIKDPTKQNQIDNNKNNQTPPTDKSDNDAKSAIDSKSSLDRDSAFDSNSSIDTKSALDLKSLETISALDSKSYLEIKMSNPSQDYSDLIEEIQSTTITQSDVGNNSETEPLPPPVQL